LRIGWRRVEREDMKAHRFIAATVGAILLAGSLSLVSGSIVAGES
jgi:hypothetical protein